MSLRTQTEPVPAVSGDKLRPFQRVGVNFMGIAESALLGDDMGCGKTVQMLELLRTIDDSLPALVICPNSVKFTWAREAGRWLPRAEPYIIGGGAVTRRKTLLEAGADPNALVIINFEGLRGHSRLSGFGSERLKRCPDCDPQPDVQDSRKCEVHPKELNKILFKSVIADEAHRIKDPHAKQTRAAWAVGHQTGVRRRYALTGTPGDPEELWSIMHFLEPLEFPTKSTYINRYCIQGWNPYGGLDVKGLHPQYRDEFYRLIDPRFRRMPMDLVLPQLPPKIRTQRFVELTPKQLKAYREMDEGLVTRLPDGSIMVAANDLVAQTRLLQFSSATMEADPSGFTMCDPSSKIDALEDVIGESGESQLAVSAEHRQLIELAARRLDRLKIPYGLITGRQQPFEREIALRDFQGGKLPVILFTHKAGGTGLTMTAANTLVCLQRSWALRDNLQTEGRVRRIGSEHHKSINIIDLIARNTVEEVQVERLYEKAERVEEINRDRAALTAAHQFTDELDAELEKILNVNLGSI
jgi:SWI/SNF-related matrix-associated actin-dependent regulator 1 of chromatin subfamily A